MMFKSSAIPGSPRLSSPASALERLVHLTQRTLQVAVVIITEPGLTSPELAPRLRACAGEWEAVSALMASLSTMEWPQILGQIYWWEQRSASNGSVPATFPFQFMAIAPIPSATQTSALGYLYVADFRPHPQTTADLASLQDLTELMAEILSPARLPPATHLQTLQDLIQELDGQNREIRARYRDLERDCFLWRQLAETPFPQILTTPAGEILSTNLAAADLLQGSCAALRGQSLLSFLTAKDRSRWQPLLQDLDLSQPLDTHGLPPLLSLRTPKRGSKSMALRISRVELEFSYGLQWLLLPRTSLTQAGSLAISAAALESGAESTPETIDWLRQILDHSSEMIGVFDPQGQLVEINQTLCQILLYSRAELLGLCLDQLDSHGSQAYLEILQTPSSSPLKRTSAWIRKDSSSIWVDITVTPLLWQEQTYGMISAHLYTQVQPSDLSENRQRYLSAVVEVQQHLLTTKSTPWDEAFYLKLLEPLGRATGATRLYVFENYTDVAGRLCMHQKAEWTALEEDSSLSPIRHLPYEQFSPGWIEALQRGEIRGGIITEGDSEARRLSTLILPLHVQGQFWGLIGFDSPVISWPWESYEIDLLRATAAAIALTLERNQAEANYRTIYEHAVEGIFQASLQGQFLTANPAMARILGYETPEDLIRSITDMNEHLVDPALRQERIQQLETEGVLTGVEFEVLRQDGTSIWVEVNARGVRDQAGQLLYVEGFAQDITTRKRALEALEESELRFRQLAENTTQVFWILNPRSGELLYVSPTCLRVWGLSPESVQTSPQIWIEWVHPEDRDSVISARSAQSQGEQTEISYRIIRPDLGLRWLHEQAFPIADNQGRVYRVAGLSEDITERKRKEQALRESEALLRTLVDHLPFDVWACDDTDRYILQKSPCEHRIEMESQVEQLDLATESLESWQKLTSRVQTGEVVQAEVHQMADQQQRTFFKILAPIMDQNQFRGLVGVSIDITERKQMEQALRQSEEHFRQIFELAPNGMVILALNGDLIRVNSAFCEILGCSAESLLSLNIQGICSAEEAALIREQMQELQQGQRCHAQMEKHLRHQTTDQILTVIWRMTVVRDPQDHPLHFLCQILDITDRKQAEKALRKSQEKYKTLFEAFPIGLLVTDAAGQVIEANPASKRLLGLEPQDLNLQNWGLIWPEGTPVEEEDLPTVQALRQARTVDYLELGISRAPQPLWLRVTATPMPLEGYGVAMAFSDITEHKRAEDALRESEIRFRAVFEQTALGIFLADQQGYYLSTNPALQTLLGYTSEALSGRLFSEFADPDQAPADLEFYPDLVQGRRSHYQVEKRYLRADGQPIWCRLTLSPVHNSRGELQFTIGITEDITEQKRSEQHIQAALQEKEILLREIHHRVKNNLQIISSLLRLQSESIKSRKYLRIFRDAWSRIESMSLIHEELYQARDLSQVNLVDYIRGLAAKLFHSYGVDSARIRLELEVEQIALNIDAGVLCGLIINELLTNSLKYAFPDGRCGCLSIRLHQDQTQTWLQVSDDGIGIPAELDWTQSPSLGLQLVSTLTEQLEGTIELDRIAGTTFTIVFPRSRS